MDRESAVDALDEAEDAHVAATPEAGRSPIVASVPRAADARPLNWRFIVPDQPPGLLLLPVADEALDGAVVPERTRDALRRALLERYAGVAVPDLGAWTFGEPPHSAVRRLAAAVAEGGWLYLGFANARSPMSLRSRRAAVPARIERALRDAGFPSIETYVPFPDHGCPAFLVPTARPAELSHFLKRLAFPYADPASRLGGPAGRRVLDIARHVAALAPHRLRVWVAPSVAFVAWRSR